MTVLVWLLTFGSETSARVRVSSRTLPVLASSTPIVTWVPSGPLIIAVASVLVTPAIDLPSTETIVSPASIPAAAAGEPGKTLATRRPRLTSITESPIPEKWPSISWLKLSSASGEK